MAQHDIHSIFENETEGLLSADRQGHIVYLNKAGAEMLGRKREELVGEALGGLFPSFNECEKRYWRAIESNMPFRFEQFYPEPVNAWLECHAYPTSDGLSLCFKNITERKRSEEALRKSIDQLEKRVQQRTDELAEVEDRLKKLAGELLRAEDNERKRITQEIHDSLSSHLVATKLFVEQKIHLDKNRKDFAKIVEMIQNAIDETRRIMANLRPPILDELGIVPTICWLVREFQTLHPAITSHMALDVSEHDIPDNLKTVVFRLVQEALNNVRKHSTAKALQVSFQKRGPTLLLEISDDGKGFSPLDVQASAMSGHGFGLRGMRERVELTGGKFTLKAAPGQGVSIAAEWETGN